MKGALYETFGGAIKIVSLPDPIPPLKGVVIKVGATGLCLSDWHGWKGHDPDIVLPHVPGHELAGEVVAVGQGVKKWKAGQVVTVPFVGGCGECTYCREGMQQVCDYQFQPGFTAWGSFAEYVAIDYADENLVALPEGMEMTHAASLGCRFITAFRAVAHQAAVQPGQWFAVHGCGGVGLSAIQIAKALGGRVVAVDISEEKCRLAKAVGADFTINAREGRVVEGIREYSRGGVHASMDALGHPETCLNSIGCLRKGGKHLQVGLLPQGNIEIPIDKVIANELQLLGSHGMQAHRYPEMFRLIQKADIPLDKLVARTASLEEVPQLLPSLDKTDTPGITVITDF
jgi:alcohol dehydrogenase